MKEEIKSVVLEQHGFETLNESILKSFLAFLDNQDPIAGTELMVVSPKIPQKGKIFQLLPWWKKSNT